MQKKCFICASEGVHPRRPWKQGVQIRNRVRAGFTRPGIPHSIPPPVIANPTISRNVLSIVSNFLSIPGIPSGCTLHFLHITPCYRFPRNCGTLSTIAKLMAFLTNLSYSELNVTLKEKMLCESTPIHFKASYMFTHIFSLGSA